MEKSKFELNEYECGVGPDALDRAGESQASNTTELAGLRQLQPTSGVESDVAVALAPWYALRVRPNYEKPVAAALRGKGFQEFLPLVQSRRQWSDRVKIMDLPLFPGYLFCRLDLNKRLPLLTTPGFLYLVGKGKTPEPVEEQEIMAIQSVVRSGLPALPWPSVAVGQK